jgi:hypothetical protein
MTREDKGAMTVAAAVAAIAIVWGWAAGAFAKTGGGTPIPTPDTGRLPGPAPAHVEPLPEAAATPVVPDELAAIAAGGVPLVDGWEVLAWYSYRGRWIRVDIRPDVDSGPHHPHGMYRWTVVGGATPLASWSTEGKGFGEIVTIEDVNTDWVASHAAEWVDAALVGGA